MTVFITIAWFNLRITSIATYVIAVGGVLVCDVIPLHTRRERRTKSITRDIKISGGIVIMVRNARLTNRSRHQPTDVVVIDFKAGQRTQIP